MKNQYEIMGDMTVIYLNRGLKTIISTNDLKRVKEFPNTWSANFNKRRSEGSQNVVIGNLPQNSRKQKRKKALLTRWILNAPDDLVVDHINHDTLDNRRENLRIVTNQENCQNRKDANRNNKRSGIRGVVPTPWGTWQAHIKIDWERKVLGTFKTLKEAHEAVIKARRELMPYSKEENIFSDEEYLLMEKSYEKPPKPVKPPKIKQKIERKPTMYWRESRKRWDVRWSKDGKRKHLGSFKTKEEAEFFIKSINGGI